MHLAPEWGGPGNLGVHGRGTPDLERCEQKQGLLLSPLQTFPLLSHP